MTALHRYILLSHFTGLRIGHLRKWNELSPSKSWYSYEQQILLFSGNCFKKIVKLHFCWFTIHMKRCVRSGLARTRMHCTFKTPTHNSSFPFLLSLSSFLFSSPLSSHSTRDFPLVFWAQAPALLSDVIEWEEMHFSWSKCRNAVCASSPIGSRFLSLYNGSFASLLSGYVGPSI